MEYTMHAPPSLQLAHSPYDRRIQLKLTGDPRWTRCQWTYNLGSSMAHWEGERAKDPNCWARPRAAWTDECRRRVEIRFTPTGESLIRVRGSTFWTLPEWTAHWGSWGEIIAASISPVPFAPGITVDSWPSSPDSMAIPSWDITRHEVDISIRGSRWWTAKDWTIAWTDYGQWALSQARRASTGHQQDGRVTGLRFRRTGTSQFPELVLDGNTGWSDAAWRAAGWLWCTELGGRLARPSTP